MIETAPKIILSNKAALALLWEMAPDHPNPMPAFLEPGNFEGKPARKPICSREGANIRVVDSQPPGIGIRENATPITHETSRFLPHFLE